MPSRIRKLIRLGILLGEAFQDGKRPDFKGSIMLLVTETQEEALDIVKSDPYVEGNVWDLDKVSCLT